MSCKMEDSGFDFCSDTSAVYDLNSDDEPPTDECLVPVIASRDGLVVKRILRIGEGVNKPGYGDQVAVRCWRLSAPPDTATGAAPAIQVQTQSLAVQLLRCITTEIVGPFNDDNYSPLEDCACGEPRIASSSNVEGHAPHAESKTSEKPQNMSPAVSMLALVDRVLLEADSTTLFLGSTGDLVLGVAEAVRTMKVHEIAVICFPKSSIHSTLGPSSALPKEAKYDIAHTKELKARARALRRLQSRKSLTMERKSKAARDTAENEQELSVVIRGKSSPDDANSAGSCGPGSDVLTGSYVTSAITTCFPSSNEIYLVELLNFNSSLALTNDRGVIKRPIKTVAPCFPSPRICDKVTYYWEVVEVVEDGTASGEPNSAVVAEGCNKELMLSKVGTRRATSAAEESPSKSGSSGSALFVKLQAAAEWRKDEILNQDSVPIPGMFHILLSMRLGDECLGVLTGEHANPARVLARCVRQNGEEDDLSLELNKLRVTVRVILSSCLRKDTILLPSVRKLNEVLPPLELRIHEKVLNTIGPKQQLVIEPGCRVLAFVSLTRQNPDGSSSSIFPFRAMAPREAGESDYRRPAKKGFVSFTAGFSTVPEWFDLITMKMRVGQRLAVDIIPRMFEDSTSFEALRCSLLLLHDRWTPNFDCIEEPPIYEFLQVRINDLEPLVENSLKACPLSSDREPALMDNATKASQSVESYLESWTLGQWTAASSRPTDVASLRQVIDSRFLPGEWDGENCRKFVDEWRADIGPMQLDIQIVEVVQRVSEPWMLTEAQRIATAMEFKGFANVLLREDLVPLAHRYYDYALNVLRFCPEVEGAMENIKTDNTPCGSVTVVAARKTAENTGTTAQLSSSACSPVEFMRAIHSNKAQCFLLESKWREASEACGLALRFGAEDAKTYYRLAKASLELDRIDECRDVIAAYNRKGKPRVVALDDLIAEAKSIDRKVRTRERNMYGGMFQRESGTRRLDSFNDSTTRVNKPSPTKQD